MSQIIRRKQIEFFTAYAGSCLEIWNSVVGQRITHKDDWIGTVVGVKKINDSIEIEVQLIEGVHRWDTPTKRFRFGKEHRLSKVFTHLTLPREIEKNSETHYWDNEEHLIYELRNLASQASIDQSTSNTFNEIYNQLMRTDRKRKLPRQTIQEINNYRQILIDKMVYELRNLASQASIDTFNRVYNQLMRMNQNRKLSEQTIQEINNYKQISMAITRFTNLSEKAMNPKVSVCFSLPKLKEEDIQLVGKWYKPPLSSLDRKLLIENHGEDLELGRLLSARSAEKIAMDFYQNQKYVREVEDISITQIKKNNDPDWEKWKKYDLNVDGRPIDVKNSRQSSKSKDRYTEHCIPSFKRIERTNQEVRIAGVFSPYLSAFELLDKPTEDHGDAEILFLGETTLKNIEKLKDEFKDLIEAPSSNKYFLFPWTFDYPEYIYTEQDNARKELKKFSNFALLKEATFGSNLIPVAIAADIDLTKILDQEDLDCWEWDFFKQLRDRIKEHGLSLPFIFFTILDHFKNTVSSNEIVSGFKPENYRKFFFYEGYEYNNPLGIYDPLKTIHALIEMLSTLWTAEKGLIRRFDMFRLVSLDIFLGKSNDDPSWTTLIAYCGGCGKNPLVLGQSKRCERRKLICPDPDCGYCCETCKRECSPTDRTHAAPTGGFKPADASETGGSDGYPPY